MIIIRQLSIRREKQGYILETELKEEEVEILMNLRTDITNCLFLVKE